MEIVPIRSVEEAERAKARREETDVLINGGIHGLIIVLCTASTVFHSYRHGIVSAEAVIPMIVGLGTALSLIIGSSWCAHSQDK